MHERRDKTAIRGQDRELYDGSFTEDESGLRGGK